MAPAIPAVCIATPQYQRHRPEDTLIYQTIAEHWATLRTEIECGGTLPNFVVAEIEAFLKCGLLCEGFLRVRCGACGHDRLVAFSCKRRGFCGSCIGRRMSQTAAHLVGAVFPRVNVRQWVLTCPAHLRFKMANDPALVGWVLGRFIRAVTSCLRRNARKAGARGQLKTGAVTVIQRWGSALNLNVHFHTLFLDGVFAVDASGKAQWLPTPGPSDGDVAMVAAKVWRQVSKRLAASAGDADDGEHEALAQITGASVRGVVATGPRRGCQVMRLGAEPRAVQAWVLGKRCAQVENFNVHANVAIRANDRTGLEHLCRYIARPPLSEQRLSTLPDGRIALALRRPFRDGTTHLVFTPQEFVEKLIPLIPRPRSHLTRYHGVLAPASGYRAQVVPGRDAEAREKSAVAPEQAPVPGPRWIPWAELLRRVFVVDALQCPKCPGRMRIIAVVNNQRAATRILAHLGMSAERPRFAPARAPPGLEDAWLD